MTPSYLQHKIEIGSISIKLIANFDWRSTLGYLYYAYDDADQDENEDDVDAELVGLTVLLDDAFKLLVRPKEALVDLVDLCCQVVNLFI